VGMRDVAVVNNNGSLTQIPSRLKGIEVVIVFLLACAFLVISMDRAINIFDEGLILSAAMRLLAGQLIHRDFYSVYGPGSYAILAGLFNVFQPSVFVARLFAVCTISGSVTLLFLILRSRVRPVVAWMIAALCLLWIGAEPAYLYPTYPCIFLALAGALVLLQPGAPRDSAMLICAGGISGLAAYFRYDAGFFILVSYSAAVFATLLARASGRHWFIESARAGMLLASGAAIVFLPGAVYYLSHASIGDFWFDIVDYTIHYYVIMRGLPFPGLLTLIHTPSSLGVYFPLVTVLISLPLIVRDWKSVRAEHGDAIQIPAKLLFGFLAAILYYKGLVRVSTIHMMLSMVPAFALLGLIVDRPLLRSNFAFLGTIGALVVLVIAGLDGGRPQFHVLRTDPRRIVLGWLAERTGILGYKPDIIESCLPWPGIRFAWMKRDYGLIAYYLARHSEPSERVLVGTDHHDKIFLNPASLYFASNRLPATHWSEYDPGLQSRSDIQRKMIDELQQNNVRFVVRDGSFDDVNEPNGSARSSGITLIDSYIDRNYRQVGHVELTSVWVRDDVVPPSTDGDPASCKLEAP
jgi:hypothetical protein